MNKALKYFSIAVYLAGLLFAVFFTSHRQFIHRRKVNLMPVRQRIDEMLLIYWRHQGVYNFVSNLIGNVLIFIPLPFALRVIRPRMSLKGIFITSVTSSIVIEIVQFVFEIGIADIDDVILNSIGALTGILVIKFFRQKNYTNLRDEKYAAGFVLRR